MKQIDTKYQFVPFWSWNDELDEKELIKQIEWMHSQKKRTKSVPTFCPLCYILGRFSTILLKPLFTK